MVETNKNQLDSSWVSLIENCKVPSVTSLKDRPLKEDDYITYKETLNHNLEALISFVRIYSKVLEENTVSDKFWVSLLVIIAEQSQNARWTTESEILREELQDIYEKLFKIKDICSTSKLLSLLFKHIQPSLLKDTWKCNPSSIQVHKFAMNILLERDLINKEFIHMIFPPLLLQIDDHQTEHKLHGLDSLHAVLYKIDISLLVEYGFDTVIFEAVKPLLYLHESEIVRLAILCLCPVLHRNNLSNSSKQMISSNNLESKFLRVFDVLEIVLSHMIVAAAPSTRIMYSEVLPVIIKSIRNGIYPWLIRLTEIYEHYLDTCVIDNYIDEEVLFNTLYCIIVTYDYFKPFGKPIFEDLIDTMLVLLLRFTEGSFLADKKVSEKSLTALVTSISILLNNTEKKFSSIVNHEMFSIYTEKYPAYNQQWEYIQRLINTEKGLNKEQENIIPSERFLYYLQAKCHEKS